MGSYWEPNPTPCARRWGPSVPGTPGAPDAPRAPRAATYLVICVDPASIFPCTKNNTKCSRGPQIGPNMLPRSVHCIACCKGKCSQDQQIMTKYVAPTCTLYCFFARESARVAHTYDPICCPEVYFVLFFARESARRANKYDQICCSEVYFVLFFCKGKCSRGPHI